MNGQTLQILVAMIIYMTAVIAIGIIFAKRANASSEDYFLGGRLPSMSCCLPSSSLCCVSWWCPC